MAAILFLDLEKYYGTRSNSKLKIKNVNKDLKIR